MVFVEPAARFAIRFTTFEYRLAHRDRVEADATREQSE
jgi:hypothetical protein